MADKEPDPRFPDKLRGGDNGGEELDDPAALADAGRVDDALDAAMAVGRRAERDDITADLMNLARHLYDESRNLGEHVRDSERGSGNELASAVYQARADGLMDACEEIRQMSRWLDGERERPPSLAHGEELTGEDGHESGNSGGNE